MKTNDKDIEAWLASQTQTFTNTTMEQEIILLRRGFKACEAKMLAEASEEFSEWHRNEYIRIRTCEDSCRFTASMFAESRANQSKAFTAGAMSQARRDAERIKYLEDEVDSLCVSLDWISENTKGKIHEYARETSSITRLGADEWLKRQTKQGGER